MKQLLNSKLETWPVSFKLIICFMAFVIGLALSKAVAVILTIVVAIILFRNHLKSNGQKTDEDEEQALALWQQIREQGSLPTVTTSLILHKHEVALLEQPDAELLETRSVREYKGGASGVRLRIAKGVSVGLGKTRGHSESHQEWRSIDVGTLVVTNKRLIFKGDKRNRTVFLNKLLSIEKECTVTGVNLIEIAEDNRKKTLRFTVDNCFKWELVIRIALSVDNVTQIDNFDHINQLPEWVRVNYQA